MSREDPEPAPSRDPDPPPVLGSWGALYVLVLGWLVVTIVLLGLVTRGCR